jgi:hypothetical protein
VYLVAFFFELIRVKENPQEQGEKTCGTIFSDKEYYSASPLRRSGL